MIAILARLLFLLGFGGLDENIHDSMRDQYLYLDIARNLVMGQGFSTSTDYWIADAGKPTSIMPPLYILFVASSFRVFGEHLIAIRLLQILLSLIVVVVIYLTGCYMFNQRTGVIAGVTTAIYPALVMYIRPIMSEGLFFPLLALLVWMTWKLDQARPYRWLYPTWGLIAGLAILTRTEIVLLVGMLLLYLIYRQWQRENRVSTVAFVMLLLALLLSLFPYAIFNYSAHGHFSPLPNAKWKFWDHTWWAEMRERPEWRGVGLPERQIVPDWEGKTELARDTYLGDMGVQFVLENPTTFLVQRVKQLFWQYPLIPREEFPPPFGTKADSTRPDGYQYGPTSLDDVVQYVTLAAKIRVWSFRLVAILAVGGIFLLVYRKERNRYWLVLILLWNVAHAMAFVGSERLRLQIDPYLILLAAFFVERLVARYERRTDRSLPRLCVVQSGGDKS